MQAVHPNYVPATSASATIKCWHLLFLQTTYIFNMVEHVCKRHTLVETSTVHGQRGGGGGVTAIDEKAAKPETIVQDWVSTFVVTFSSIKEAVMNLGVPCFRTDLRRMPPSREALRHSGGDSLLFTSAMVTLYLEVELSSDSRPGTEQNKSVGFTTHVPPAHKHNTLITAGTVVGSPLSTAQCPERGCLKVNWQREWPSH